MPSPYLREVVYPGESERPLELQHRARVPVQVDQRDVFLVSRVLGAVLGLPNGGAGALGWTEVNIRSYLLCIPGIQVGQTWNCARYSGGVARCW